MIVMCLIWVLIGVFCVRLAAIYSELNWLISDPWAPQHINTSDYSAAIWYMRANPHFRSILLGFTLLASGCTGTDPRREDTRSQRAVLLREWQEVQAVPRSLNARLLGRPG